jgi:hypothetical protein
MREHTVAYRHVYSRAHTEEPTVHDQGTAACNQARDRYLSHGMCARETSSPSAVSASKRRASLGVTGNLARAYSEPSAEKPLAKALMFNG